MENYSWGRANPTARISTAPSTQFRDGDFTGDASRFGKRLKRESTRIRGIKGGNGGYVGVIESPLYDPKDPRDELVKSNADVNAAKTGLSGAIFAAVQAGMISVDDLSPKDLRRYNRYLSGS